MAKSKRCATLLLVGLVMQIALASKLNVVRILLPYFEEISSNFTLVSTDNTCLKWSATRDDVIKLTPLHPCPELDCSASVIVSTITKDRSKVSVDIFAEDPITQQSLRAVVIVDVIHSLDIVTKTREVILEEAPEIFEVRAYDNQGNEFSTLSGVPMTWIISPMGSTLDIPVVKLIPFRDSSYETPTSLIDLEERGLWGDKVLLEGCKTGLSKVSVKLNQKEYEFVKSNEIMLSVVANFMILPPEVFIMAGDVVRFRIIQTSYGKMEEIELKTSQYYMKIENSEIAVNEMDPNTIKAIELGQTKVILCDHNMDEDIGEDMQVPMPSAIINVVRPAYMLLSLLPFRNWNTMVKESHEIVAEVYTENDRKLLIGGDFYIQTTIADIFHVHERSANGSWHFGWAEHDGTAAVSAVLDSVHPPLRATAEIWVYPRIVLTPNEIILPWDSTTKPKYDVDFKASGGDGKFLWSSTNNSIGVVSQFGRVHTHNMGVFEVSAAMQRNHNNRQTAKLFILPPTKLEITDYVMEAEVGTVIYIQVALYVHKPSSNVNQPMSLIPVSRCQDLEFKVRTTDPKFKHERGARSDPVGIACGNVAITSSEPGTSKVTISYTIGSTKMEDSVSLTFFLPLKVMQPTGTILLAVGSATNVIFSGGPKVQSVAQKAKVSIHGDNCVSTSDVTAKHKMPQDDTYTVLHVLCRKLGTSNITVTVANPPKTAICHNQESATSISVVCAKPRKLEMQPEMKVTDVTSCPMDLSSERIAVENGREIKLFIRVFDVEGREFMNVSSLQFQFETRNKGDAIIGDPSNVNEMPGMIGTAMYANKTTQKVTPSVNVGEINLIARVIGYNKNVLRMNELSPEEPLFVPINATITMFLVEDTIVTPNEVSIFNHPNNDIQLDVQHGSGYYSISMTRNDVVEAKYIEKTRKLSLKPINNGDVAIKLTDLCLLHPAALVSVNVVAIASIHVEMSDKVELGKCVVCTVTLFDDQRRRLEIPNGDLVDMSYSLGRPLATIERLVKPASDIKPDQLQYVVTGDELGDTNLLFYVGDPDYDGYVASNMLQLQVFPPLRIIPRSMVIVQGAVVQFTVKGGPQPTSDMQFTVENENTASICDHGVVTGLKVGSSKVLARAIGESPLGEKIIYSEDTAEIQVIALTSVYISTPSTKLKVGAILPLWASAKPDQISPFTLATIMPSMEYSWSVCDAHIARIYDIVEGKKVEKPSTNVPFVRLQGLAAGKTMVYLNATTSNNRKLVIYASSLEIDVVIPLQLQHPENLKGESLHMAPNSCTQLVTNYDEEHYEVNYRMMGDSSYSTDVQYKSPVVSSMIAVTREGLVKAGGQLGIGNVVATSMDHMGSRQSLIIPIEVKNVHYMMLSVASKWRIQKSDVEHTIPLGVEMDLHVSFFGNLGQKLISNTNDVAIKPSRQDLVMLHRKSNDTFTISTKKPGITVLEITSDCGRIVDYIKLNVSQLITPNTDEIVVGDVVWYNTAVSIAEDVGEWSSSDKSVLDIDASTGVGIALAPGRVTVFHQFHPAAPVQITVFPISDFTLDTQNTSFTSAGEFRLYTTLHSSRKPSMHNFHVDHDFQLLGDIKVHSPLSCSLKFENSAISSKLFALQAQFDFMSGRHYCSIKSLEESRNDTYLMPKSVAYLSVLVVGSDLPAKQVKLDFAPGIQIPEAMVIDARTHTGEMVLYGAQEALQSTLVKPSDENLLTVAYKTQDTFTTVYTVEVHTNDLHMYRDMLYLDVEVATNNQKQRVNIMLSSELKMIGICVEHRSSLWTAIYNNKILVGVIIGALLIISICSYVYVNYIQPPQAFNVTVVPITDIRGSTDTRGSPGSTSGSLDGSGILDTSAANCFCTRSPEIRRIRRYM